MQLDKNRREIKAGDLLKIPHFMANSGRIVYMYKLVMRVNSFASLEENGEYLYCVDVTDIARKHSLELAHKCPLSVIEKCEIIDDSGNGKERSFWERKKHKTESPAESLTRSEPTSADS